MEDKNEEKYLGDVISHDGRNIKNIKARVNKGTGIVNNIMTKLEGIPFGKYYFEVAMILRNSLLVSSVLCNSEAWYNVTGSELDYLESVDLMLLSKILNTPKSTPKEMMYLELGCLPLRDIVVFPGMVAPLFVGRKQSVNALNHVMTSDKKIFLLSSLLFLSSSD